MKEKFENLKGFLKRNFTEVTIVGALAAACIYGAFAAHPAVLLAGAFLIAIYTDNVRVYRHTERLRKENERLVQENKATIRRIHQRIEHLKNS